MQAACEKETMNDGKSLNSDATETLAMCEINAVFYIDGVHLKQKKCWEQGEVCDVISKHPSPRKSAAKFCNVSRNICRVTCIRTLMREPRNG